MFVKLQFLNTYLNFIGDGIVFQYEKLEGIGVTHFSLYYVMIRISTFRLVFREVF